jgi:hypothetical protein
LRSFEVWPYERLVVLSLSVLYALLFLTWGRIMAIWAKFHLFLESLERHPIRFAFSALPREETWSPIFHASAGKRSYTAEVHVRDGLKVLSEYLSPALQEAACKYNHQLELVLKRATAGLRVPWSAHRDLGERLGEVDNLLIEILQPHWDSGEWETAPAAKPPQKQSDSSDDQQDARPVETSLWPDDDPGRAAQTMIAFQLIGYVRYTLHQVRNLIYFVMVGFVLSMAALDSYPSGAEDHHHFHHHYVSGVRRRHCAGDGTGRSGPHSEPHHEHHARSSEQRLLQAPGHLPRRPPADRYWLAGSLLGTLPVFVGATGSRGSEMK